MSIGRKLGVLLLVTCWSAVIMTVILAIASYFRPTPIYTIPLINLTLSRWWDILILPIMVNIIACNYLFIAPYFEKKYPKYESAKGLKDKLVFWFGSGFVPGLYAGGVLMVALTAEIVFGVEVGLGFALMLGLGLGLWIGLILLLGGVLMDGFEWLIKKIVAYHRYVLEDL